MSFGEGIRNKLLKLFSESNLDVAPEQLLYFTEAITDQTISKNLSYEILDCIAEENNIKLMDIIRKEYLARNIILSVNLREYPDLFSRRIYIPLRDTIMEMVISILASLRISNYEALYVVLDSTTYQVNKDSKLNEISMLNLRDYRSITLVYGKDSWTFDISIIGLTYVKEDEVDLPFIVEDAVGYGIVGMSKQILFNQLEDSKDLALDTKNPIMDDEEYEFYNANTDELNENSKDDYNVIRKEYLGNE